MRKHAFEATYTEWVGQCIYCGLSDDYQDCEVQEKINKSHTWKRIGDGKWKCFKCDTQVFDDGFPPHTTRSCPETVIKEIIE